MPPTDGNTTQVRRVGAENELYKLMESRGLGLE